MGWTFPGFELKVSVAIDVSQQCVLVFCPKRTNMAAELSWGPGDHRVLQRLRFRKLGFFLGCALAAAMHVAGEVAGHVTGAVMRLTWRVLLGV